MTTITKQKRGFFGTIFLWVFILFNGFMVAWLGFAIAEAPEVISGLLASGFIAIFWVLGSIITGLLAALTKGNKTITVTT